MMSRLLRSDYCGLVDERLVHSGQHHDGVMSGLFLREMGTPEPHANLDIGSDLPGRTGGQMLDRMERHLLRHLACTALVCGDTNSTFAGALAASKPAIRTPHLAVGLRCFWRRMPKEEDWIVTVHVATLQFCPTETACCNLAHEGIFEGVHVAGDSMYNACLHYSLIARGTSSVSRAIPRLGLTKPHVLLTLRWAEDTDSQDRLCRFVEVMNEVIEIEFWFTSHPHTAGVLRGADLQFASRVYTLPPEGYLDMMELQECSSGIEADPNGVQEGAFLHQRHHVLSRDQIEWVEPIDAGAIALEGMDGAAVASAIRTMNSPRGWRPPFGDGHAAKAMTTIIVGSVCGYLLGGGTVKAQTARAGFYPGPWHWPKTRLAFNTPTVGPARRLRDRAA